MSSGLEFKYGNYDFRPRPRFSVRSSPLKSPDGSGFGVMHTVSLEGDLLLTGTIELDSGIVGVSAKIEQLKDALDQDGRLLAISCNDQPIISGYPTIESYTFDKESDNMVRRASYTIEFQMPTLKRGQDTNPKISGVDPFNSSVKFPEYIESASESWDVEFADERLGFEWTLPDISTTEKFGYKLAVTHSVDVKARLTYTGELGGVGGTPQHNIPWQDARNYATGLLGFDSEFVTLTGVLGLPGSPYFAKFDVFNHFRQVSINKTEGSVRVTETFIVTPSGTDSLPNNAIETFEISVAQNEGLASVNIAGTIEGLASTVYSGVGVLSDGFYVSSSKFSAASGYYNKIKGRLFDRAKVAYFAVTGECFDRPLNAIVRNRSVGMNPLEGSISYDYEFDTATSGCVTGSCVLSQNITIDDTLANDVFASQVVLGRAAGPILQDIGTITARTRSVNVELVTLPPVACTTIAEIYAPVPTGAVEEFIAVVSGDLASSYSQVFVSSQSQSWNFTIGRYSRSISFTYNNCSS